MIRIQRVLGAVAVALVAVACSCSSDSGTGEHGDSDILGASRGEHDRDSGAGGEGEEAGAELALDEGYDKVRNGVRLVVNYNAESNSFNGTVENTTDDTLRRVRVEVHLSNGIELGPTTPTDLGPGQQRDVELMATSKDFDRWGAHPEVGSGEGEGEEHDG